MKVDAYPSTPQLESHWVLVTRREGNKYYINDPYRLTYDPNDLLSRYHDATYDNTFFAMRVYHGTTLGPEITSISPAEVAPTTFDLTIDGDNFDDGAVDQIYWKADGHFVGQGEIFSRSSTRIVVRERMEGATPGVYIVKVRNSDAQLSNGVELTLTDFLPVVNGFDVTPRTVILGDSFTISYTVSDDVGLSWIELWRRDDSRGIDWEKLDERVISGTIASGSFTNTPILPGSYSYGVHVGDTAGHWSVEPDPPGPVRVQVADISRIIRLTGDLTFGDVQVNTAQTRALTTHNDGNSVLTVHGISYPEGFTGVWTGTIGAGDFVDVPVEFSPSDAKVYSGDLVVGCDATSGSNSYPVSGRGIQPPTRIVRLAGDLNFGDVFVGSSEQRTLTIYNDGNATLAVKSITCPPGFSGAWSGTITAGSFQNVTVTFSPTEEKAYGGDLVVNSDKTSGTNIRAVSGTGKPVPTLSATRSLSQRFYSSPGTVEISIEISYGGDKAVVVLAVAETMPPGWSFASVVSTPALLDLAPATGETGKLQFNWTEWSGMPSFPAVLTYRLSVPPGETGRKTISGTIYYAIADGEGSLHVGGDQTIDCGMSLQGPSIDADTGDLVLSWEGVPGKLYQVEASGDLQSWLVAGDIIEAPIAGRCSWHDPGGAAHQLRFYRLMLVE